MDIEKLFNFIQKLFPGLSVFDALQFGLLWLGYKRFNNIKSEVLEDVSKKYIQKITDSIETMAESITSIKYEMVRTSAANDGQFQALKDDIKGSNEFRDRLMQKLEKIEKTQERHTFIFEGQNTEMYADRMLNIKRSAREFFADWKVRLHKRVMVIDWAKPIHEIYVSFFKLAMDDLAEWTIEFRKRIHPSHMAIIENEVNPKSISLFSDALENKILPSLCELSKDVNFEKKSFDVIDTFLDTTDRSWEELMELTFRSKRAKGDI